MQSTGRVKTSNHRTHYPTGSLSQANPLGMQHPVCRNTRLRRVMTTADGRGRLAKSHRSN